MWEEREVEVEMRWRELERDGVDFGIKFFFK